MLLNADVASTEFVSEIPDVAGAPTTTPDAALLTISAAKFELDMVLLL